MLSSSSTIPLLSAGESSELRLPFVIDVCSELEKRLGEIEIANQRRLLSAGYAKYVRKWAVGKLRTRAGKNLSSHQT